MEANEKCSECGAEAFSIINNSGFGNTHKCEGCGTLFKLEKIKNPIEKWFFLFILIVVATSILGRFIGSAFFSLIVICLWVALGIFTVVFLLATLKVKTKLVKLAKT
ncbi:MAG TPA: hypothetical protein VGE32_16630 [Cellvibrio sp.]